MPRPKVKGQGHQGQKNALYTPITTPRQLHGTRGADSWYAQDRTGTRSLKIMTRSSRREHSAAAGVMGVHCVKMTPSDIRAHRWQKVIQSGRARRGEFGAVPPVGSRGKADDTVKICYVLFLTQL